VIEVSYIEHMGTDWTVCNAARTSFAKRASEYSEEKNIELLNYLAKHKHFLPFRHPQISLHIKAPIFVIRQIDKHQVGFSTSEISRRYVDTEPEMFLPDKWRKRADNVKQGSLNEGVDLYNKYVWTEEPEYGWDDYTVQEMLDEHWERSNLLYNRLISSYVGVAPEQARMILPQAMVTEQYKTGSLFGWFHLVSLRKEEHAQKEAQDLATQVEEIIAPLFPEAWKALSNV
jgi:thymidylate synthase (FAD)